MGRLLWTLKQHVGPKPRVRHAAAFDGDRAHMLVFAGDSLDGSLFRDTWAWDGDCWCQLNDAGPAARASSAMACDSLRGRVVLFGGNGDSALFADTWEWDGDSWIQMADTGPSPRSGHGLVFDSSRGRIVLFGGAPAGGSAHGDTWEWDGVDWVQVDDTGPDPRSGHAMTFDAARRRTVLFGGWSPASALGDTWEYDGRTWTHISDFGPPPAIEPTLVYADGRSLLYGGASALTGEPGLFRHTWEWDGKHWSVRQDLGPGERWGHTMVFDAVRRRGVLFGGTASLPGAASPAALGETWEQFEQSATSRAPMASSGVNAVETTRADLNATRPVT